MLSVICNIMCIYIYILETLNNKFYMLNIVYCMLYIIIDYIMYMYIYSDIYIYMYVCMYVCTCVRTYVCGSCCYI